MHPATPAPTPPPARSSRRMERGVVGLFAAAAAVIGLTLAMPAIRRIGEIVSDRSPVRLLTSEPVPTGSESGGATLISAHFDSASVVASGLSDGARTLLAVGAGVGALTLAATAGAVMYFLLLLLWKRPFHRSLVVATQLAGAALLIGGIVSAGVSGLGTMMAATELNPVAGDVFDVAAAFDPAVFFAGIGVLALSFVFDRGARMQRDTEGLV